jgi:glutathione S-transferase
MVIKIFYVPRTRATRPRWLLEELGVAYELVRLDPSKKETRTPEHLARQPLGHVPALEDVDVRIFESGAICLHLADRYGGGRLLPPPGSAARAAVYQWCFFVATELEPALAALAQLTWNKPEAEQDRAAVTAAKERAARVLLVLERAVAGGGWLAGPELTVADLMLGSFAGFVRAKAALLDALPPDATALRAFFDRVAARPAFQRATAD